MSETPILPVLGQEKEPTPYYTENGHVAEAIQFLHDSREAIGARDQFDLERDEPIYPERWEALTTDTYAVPTEKPRTYVEELSAGLETLGTLELTRRIGSTGRAVVAFRHFNTEQRAA